MRFPFFMVGIGVALLVLSGCAIGKGTVDESFRKLLPATWTTEGTLSKLPVSASLLDMIDSVPLRTLVQEAMNANPDLQATAKRLKAAYFRHKGQRTTFLPNITAEFSKGLDNQTVDSQTEKTGTAHNHEVSLGVSWEIDLWGRLADQFAASRQSLIALRKDYQNARDALAARVIQAWIEQVASRRALIIETERVAVLQDIEAVLIDRYKNGLGSLDEYATAKSRTQIALADQRVQQAKWRQSIRLLEVLLGRSPQGVLLTGDTLPVVAPVPVKTPVEVMRNRPDIQAALERVVAAKRLSSAAHKALLPQLTLSGKLFRSAARIGEIGKAITYWEMLGSLFQPLFQGGNNINEARATRVEYEAALMDLRSVVLRALREVEDALDLEHELAAQMSALEIAERESATSSRYFAERYRQGLDTIQSLLIAKEQEMSVRIRLNQVTAERLSNRIDLALALGLPNDGKAQEGKESCDGEKTPKRS